MRGGCLTLSSASLTLVGFASWTISDEINNRNQASLNTEADGDVADINKFIVYKASKVFEFCCDGLVKDDRIVNSGVVSASFSIETEDTLLEHLPKNTSSFILSTYLYDTDSIFVKDNTDTLFSTYIDTKSKVQAGFSTSQDQVEYNTQLDFSISGNCCKASFPVSKFLDQSKVYFSIKYPFVFEKNTFKDNIFPQLFNKTLKLSFKAEVELQ